MASFKINHVLRDLMAASGLKSSFIGCSPICDKQMIPNSDICNCLRVIKENYAIMKEDIRKIKIKYETALEEEKVEQTNAETPQESELASVDIEPSTDGDNTKK